MNENLKIILGMIVLLLVIYIVAAFNTYQFANPLANPTVCISHIVDVLTFAGPNPDFQPRR